MTNATHTTKTIPTTDSQFDRFCTTTSSLSYGSSQLPLPDCIDETEVYAGIIDAAEIDVESKKMFESNEKRLRFLEQEVIRLSQVLNSSAVVVDDSAFNKT